MASEDAPLLAEVQQSPVASSDCLAGQQSPVLARLAVETPALLAESALQIDGWPATSGTHTNLHQSRQAQAPPLLSPLLMVSCSLPAWQEPAQQEAVGTLIPSMAELRMPVLSHISELLAC